jgi:hypothetical protein
MPQCSETTLARAFFSWPWTLVGNGPWVILASVYSSEAGEWSDTISIGRSIRVYIDHFRHSAVIGNMVYLPCVERRT